MSRVMRACMDESIWIMKSLSVLSSQCLWSGQHPPLPWCLQPDCVGEEPLCVLRDQAEGAGLRLRQVGPNGCAFIQTVFLNTVLVWEREAVGRTPACEPSLFYPASCLSESPHDLWFISHRNWYFLWPPCLGCIIKQITICFDLLTDCYCIITAVTPHNAAQQYGYPGYKIFTILARSSSLTQKTMVIIG